ncbi:hypothetical protein GGTG_11138 [Gaeumannomyces tritici R3-111a-1]|uniref:Uncharacterized protein n=1 Tax=Gaeumannomyces tritici (strain R3-111a-1) TaxID=644352 RepID=J3PCB5_GAET3|nr:hypothetical protein GGTG_11138 [Gaeumannomyces tritici R3-111a-1]EJT71885.1 hypothetical protein GGTG_11138 [Gaeumannomyces tritici R3-111a-1]
MEWDDDGGFLLVEMDAARCPLSYTKVKSSLDHGEHHFCPYAAIHRLRFAQSRHTTMVDLDGWLFMRCYFGWGVRTAKPGTGGHNCYVGFGSPRIRPETKHPARPRLAECLLDAQGRAHDLDASALLGLVLPVSLNSIDGGRRGSRAPGQVGTSSKPRPPSNHDSRRHAESRNVETAAIVTADNQRAPPRRPVGTRLAVR